MRLGQPTSLAEAFAAAVVLVPLAAGMAILPRPLLPFVLIAVAAVVATVYLKRPLLPLLALLAFYPFYMVVSGLFLSRIPGFARAALGGVKELLLLGLLGLVMAVPRGETFARRRPLWTVMAGFYALLIALVVLSPAPLSAALASARFHLTYPLLLPVALVLVSTDAARRQVVGVVLVAATIAALGWLAALGFAGLSGLSYASARTSVIFAAGDFGDPINVLGTYMAIAICLALGLAEEARTGRVRGMLYMLVALYGWALLSTFSRRAILGAALGALVIAWVRRSPRIMAAGVVAGVGIVAYGSTVLLSRLSLSYAAGHEGTSVRLRHLWYTLENLDPVSFLTGHGVGTAGHVALVAGTRDAVDLHNYYLLLLFESGMFGLGLYLVFCWLVFRALRRTFAMAPDVPASRGLVLGTLGALPAFLATGMFGIGNGVLPNAPIVWALAGCALAISPALAGAVTDSTESAAPPETAALKGIE